MARGVAGHLCTLGMFVFTTVTIAVLLRTFTLHHRVVLSPECRPTDTDFIRGDKGLIGRYQQSVRFRTVSYTPTDISEGELLKIHDFITTSYRTLHSSPLVTREVIANYSLLYTIRGSDPSLKPLMLTGHLDVVPVTEEEWEVPPFSGEIHNGFIYGRGTMDDKNTVMGIFEAVEFLLKRGFQPRRTIILGFGHDEEVGGEDGARNIARTLMSRGITVEFLVDEGMGVVDGIVPGVDRPVALVASTEKGRVNIKLSVSTQGGHSSMPRKESSIGILSRAINRLESNPHPSMFGTGPERATFEHLAPEMIFPLRVVMSNLWLFSPIVSWLFSMSPDTNAFTRTTTAVTVFRAGIKENVIAPYAEASVNHRIHPSQTVKEVLEYDKQIINDDRVEIEVVQALEPLPHSPHGDGHFGWQTIKTSIHQVWGYSGVMVAPTVDIGNSDTRHYTNITQNLYRFPPTYMYDDDIGRVHGANERMSVKNYVESVNFFYHLIANADESSLAPTHAHTNEL